MKSRSQIPPSSNTGGTGKHTIMLQPAKHGGRSDFLNKTKKSKTPLPVDNLLMDIVTNVAKYDWFGGMIECNELEILLGLLCNHLGDTYPGFDSLHDTSKQGRFLNKKPLYVAKNYKYSIHFMEGLESLCSLSFGGSNHQYGLYLTITGKYSDILFQSIYKMLQDNNIRTSTSRLDVAYDIQGDFKQLLPRLIKIARNHNLEYKTITSNNKEGETQGTTLYVYVTAMITLRVYEKGYERESAGVSDAPTDWVRFELENKVPKEREYEIAKWCLPQVPLMSILTATKALQEMFNTFSGLSESCANIIYTKKPLKKSLDERLNTFVHQNRNLILELLDNKENTQKFIGKVFPDPFEISTHLKTVNPFFEYIENQEFLKHGEY